MTDIDKRNEAIALYMGAIKYGYMITREHKAFHFYTGYPFEIRTIKDSKKNIIDQRDLKYHSSWDWLMNVVENIESEGFSVDIDEKMCGIYKNGYIQREYMSQESKKDAVFNCVSDYCLNIKKE